MKGMNINLGRRIVVSVASAVLGWNPDPNICWFCANVLGKLHSYVKRLVVVEHGSTHQCLGPELGDL